VKQQFNCRYVLYIGMVVTSVCETDVQLSIYTVCVYGVYFCMFHSENMYICCLKFAFFCIIFHFYCTAPKFNFSPFVNIMFRTSVISFFKLLVFVQHLLCDAWQAVCCDYII
jgi:hypothetical protein